MLVLPPRAVSLDEAHAAVDLWEFYAGKKLDADQVLAVEVMMALDGGGRWAAQTTGREMPRQNGKGEEVEVVELWGLVKRGEAIMHTVHDAVLLATKTQHRLLSLLDGHSDLRREKKRVWTGTGQQMIESRAGGVIWYRTRTGAGGRGVDNIDRLVVDEAQHAAEEHLASVAPTLLANDNAQMNVLGTAGLEGKSEWWWRIRKRALTPDPGDFGYVGHTAEQVEINQDGHVIQHPVDVDDRENWAKANPALRAGRVGEEFFEEQLLRLGPDSFAREHLCVWDPYPNAEGGFLPADKWLDAEVESPKLASVSFGLSVSESSAAVASAGRLPNGDLYVDTVHYHNGTDWVEEWVVEHSGRKRKPYRVHPSAPEGGFVRPLREAGVDVVEVTPRQYQQACAEFLDSLKNGTLKHLGQSHLTRAVRAVQRRDVGKEGGWVWAESSVDLSPLKAATLALTGVTKRRPPRIHVLEEDE